MSIAVPADELSIDSKRNAKLVTRRRLVDLMIASGKAQNARQVTIREIQASVDLGMSAGTDSDEFISAATTANTDTVYVNSSLGNNKYAGFYGVSIVNASVQPAIWGIVFKIGTGGANVLADLDLQGGYGYENPVWFVDDPVIYQPTDTVYVILRNAVSQSGGVNVCLRGFLAEPAGQSVM